MTLVVRPDLSARTALSKSELSGAFWCPTKAAFQRITREKFVVTPEMTFGSALDAGIEKIGEALRSGQDIDLKLCLASAEEVAGNDGHEVDLDELEDAFEKFVIGIVPRYDWAFVGLQHRYHMEAEGLGEVEGHPDIRFSDGSIRDVKAAKKTKTTADIRFAPELPFYAYLQELESGVRPPTVGYFAWLRGLKKPMWQDISEPVDGDLIAEGMTTAMRRVNARRLIDAVKAAGQDPCLYFDGPRFDSLCNGCQFLDRCSTGQRRVRPIEGVPDGIAA